MSRNCSSSAGSRSTTSPSIGGRSGARPCWPRPPGPAGHAVGHRWWVDETYVKVAGRWRYVYRAIDQFGQVIDVCVSPRRDATAARRFFERAIGETKTMPVEVVTDLPPVYPGHARRAAAMTRTDPRAGARPCSAGWPTPG